MTKSDIDFKLAETIKEKLNTKDTQELTEIYQQHDRERWSNEAFEAIRQLLFIRGENVPTEPPSELEQPLSPSGRKKEIRRYTHLWGLIGGLAGSVVVVVISVSIGIAGRGMFEYVEDGVLAGLACLGAGSIVGHIVGSILVPKSTIPCPNCGAQTFKIEHVNFWSKKVPNRCKACGHKWFREVMRRENKT